MGFLDRARAEIGIREARELFESGHQIYMWGYRVPVWKGGEPVGLGKGGVAEQIEAIEACGWRLDQMDWFWSSTGLNQAIGVFLFRRDPANLCTRLLTLALPEGGREGWYSDPSGRHAQRYFDGVRWTAHSVSTDGEQLEDEF